MTGSDMAGRQRRQAGLDGLVKEPQEFGRRYAHVVVAADQLEQARAIATQPIPQEIVYGEAEAEPEFVEPECPKCGSNDVVLEGVDPKNRWRCEECGEQWLAELPQAEG